MKNVCVIGHPIKHSRSPLIHGYWLKKYGIEGHYSVKDIAPAELATFLKNLANSEFIGCNVTVPHKETSLKFIDHIDDRVTRIGALNTVYVRDGKTHATSSDGFGFVSNIKWRHPHFDFREKHALVLGAGGSTRAIVDELLRNNIAKITIANRTIEKAQTVANLFPQDIQVCGLNEINNVLGTCDLLINTTSAGITDDKKLELPLQYLRRSALVADINYVPLLTPLSQQAQNLGLDIVPGLGMLLFQAVVGFELWFDQKPIVDEALYDLIATDIDPGYKP
jgi:shikimate dehydrogenase